MREVMVPTALEMQRASTEAAREGALVLCATGRLARRYLHAYRMEALARDLKAWETPLIFSLSRWARATYQRLWEPRRPLVPAASLRLWHEVIQAVPPPEGLEATPSLYSQLQDALDLLEAYRIREVPDCAEALASWRARASEEFRRRLEQEDLVSFAGQVEAVRTALSGGTLALPGRVILAGFDLLRPMDASLAEALDARTSSELWRAMRPADPGSGVRLFASPEQEALGVAAEVLDAWNAGRKELAVIPLDALSGGLLARCLEELVAGESLPEGALRYNVAGGLPLAEHPLARTALLPLRLAVPEGDLSDLRSLLLSPYGRTDLSRLPRRAVDALFASPSDRTPIQALSALRREHRIQLESLEALLRWRERPLAEWLDGLERAWKELGFVRRAERAEVRATDEIAWKHLGEALGELKAEAGRIRVSAGGAHAWLAEAASGFQVALKTPETVGVQVLSPFEARGLAFGTIWMVGCHGRVLPRSREDLPLLSHAERAALEGASPGGAWASGLLELESLMAGAPDVRMSRAAQAGDEQPFLPCPLVPDAEGEGSSVDLWRDPPDAWARAPWLGGGYRGLASPSDASALAAVEEAPAPLPETLGVTRELEPLLQCPFRYFAQGVLKLEPLPEPAAGLDPMRRGDIAHKILRAYVAPLLEPGQSWPGATPEEHARLESCAVDILDHEEPGWRESPFWRVERLRLLGDGEFPGVLQAWLEEESVRAAQGWTFAAVEAPFGDLEVAGFRVRGRADRVDRGPGGAVAVWDYKTGAPPKRSEILEEFAWPQIPTYAAAVEEGCAGDARPEGDAPLLGGYIPLRKASEVAVAPLKHGGRGAPLVDWRAERPRWEKSVTERLAHPAAGRWPADPRPPYERGGSEGACRYCPYPDLCGYFDTPAPPGQEEEEEP